MGVGSMRRHKDAKGKWKKGGGELSKSQKANAEKKAKVQATEASAEKSKRAMKPESKASKKEKDGAKSKAAS